MQKIVSFFNFHLLLFVTQNEEPKQGILCNGLNLFTVCHSVQQKKKKKVKFCAIWYKSSNQHIFVTSNQQGLPLPCKRIKEKKCNKIKSYYWKEGFLLLIYIVSKDTDYNPFGWDKSIHMHCSLKMPSLFPLTRNHWFWWRETLRKK